MEEKKDVIEETKDVEEAPKKEAPKSKAPKKNQWDLSALKDSK